MPEGTVRHPQAVGRRGVPADALLPRCLGGHAMGEMSLPVQDHGRLFR